MCNLSNHCMHGYIYVDVMVEVARKSRCMLQNHNA